MPVPTPAPITSVTRSRERSDLERQDAEELDQEAVERFGGARQDRQRDGGAQEADEGPLEDERPADERVRCPDQPHDLDLLGAGDHREADRVHDDEQHDQTDSDQQDRACVRRMLVTVRSRSTRSSMLMTLRTIGCSVGSSASPTALSADGSVSLTSRLA